MKQLPCIGQYVLGQRLKTIITMTNNLTDMSFDDNSYVDTRANTEVCHLWQLLKIEKYLPQHYNHNL